MKKKISQIVTYSLLGVVVLGFILCSIIKINFRPEMKLPTTADNDKIQISVSGTAKVESSDENINYKTFTSKFDDSFKLTILYSLFSGKIGNEMVIDETKSEPSYTGYKVQFIYAQTQTLKKDGKEVPIADNSNTPITYNSVVFDVPQDKGLVETNIYFYNTSETNYYKLTVFANFDNLYTYISEISMFGE